MYFFEYWSISFLIIEIRPFVVVTLTRLSSSFRCPLAAIFSLAYPSFFPSNTAFGILSLTVILFFVVFISLRCTISLTLLYSKCSPSAPAY